MDWPLKKRCLTRHITNVAGLVTLLMVNTSWASYGYYVGKNLTADGSVLIGGTGEEPSSHWLEIVPRRNYPPGSTITVGATEQANLPASLSQIPQVRQTFRYITMNYSSYAGFPAPITNGGLNEHQVAIRDIWSPSRDELVAMTPEGQTGPNYSDLARIALERATSAREAVEIIGGLINEYGYTTYGGNSHLIADENEGWVVIQYAGGQGLWAAERLGPDDVRVNYPGYIEEVPEDFMSNPDFMASPNFYEFAIDQGWYDPDSGQPLNADLVYGGNKGTTRERGTKFVSPGDIEAELRSMAPVTIEEMMALVRDPRITDDHAGYGQVASLRDDLEDPALGLLWVAPTGSVAAPFLPWWIGTQEVPAEYGQHRYLTEGAAPSFINPQFQLQEASEFAGRTFKRLMYYTCAKPAEQLPRVQASLTAFEAQMLQEIPTIEKLALAGLEDERQTGETLLTYYSQSRAREALEIGRKLLAGIETEMQLRYGITAPPPGADINAGGRAVSCLIGANPDRRPDQQ